MIFEKINGYQDGSYYTPSYVTEYMSKKTIEYLVIDKVNEYYNQNISNVDDLIDFIDDNDKRKTINELIDSLKICDPAVGSGHFLVSILNRILAFKSEIGVLFRVDGRRLREYSLEIYDDTLYVYDGQHNLFVYDKNSIESQMVQKTLFSEKRKIIENVLFGVDLNKNAASICRLRLWIELLKNAYYENNIMETLPNIDIDIKVGNSLIAKVEPRIDSKVYSTTTDDRDKRIIKRYKKLVQDYKNESDKYRKRDIINQIDTERALLHNRFVQYSIFGDDVIDDFYKNAFEWMLEFPEIITDNGIFTGFDCIIGNPPYGVEFSTKEKSYFKKAFVDVHFRTPDSYLYFISNSFKILKKNGYLSFIVPNNILYQKEATYARRLLLSKSIKNIVNLGDDVFEPANVPTAIFISKNSNNESNYIYNDIRNVEKEEKKNHIDEVCFVGTKRLLNDVPDYSFGMSDEAISIFNKINEKSDIIDSLAYEVSSGISTGKNEAYIVEDEEIENQNLEIDFIKPLIIGSNIGKYIVKKVGKIIYVKKGHQESEIPNIIRRLYTYKEFLEKRREAKNGVIPWWALNWPRNEESFNKNKIVIRQTSDHIVAAYDDEKNYPLNSLLVLLLDDDTILKDVVGVLNSKLIDYVYTNLTQEKGRQYAEVKPINVRKLPIPKEIHSLGIGDIVTKIIANQKLGVDTTELEDSIEKILQKYYSLTQEEINYIYS